MRISFMTFACPQWTFEQVLDAAIQHRYHGIEFRCDAQQRHGIEVTATEAQRQRFRARLESVDVESCCLATSLQLISEKVLEDVPPRVKLAADIGSPALRIFCGSPAEPMDTTEIVEVCSRHLQDAAEIAAQSDIELWLETHDTISKAADCAAIVRRTNHPAVGINYDNMHPYRVGEPLETTVAALGTLVRHTHFHDSAADAERVVIKPLDKGELPMDEMFQHLLNMGYDGYLSGEWFGEMYGGDPDQSIAAYRQDMIQLAHRNGMEIE